MKNAAKRLLNAVTGERFTKGYTAGLVLCYGMALVSTDAAASATAKETAVSVFNILYSLVGVGGGIAMLVQLLNTKFGNLLGIQDPRKKLVETLIYTVIAFAIVAIIQLAKSYGAGNSDIGSV
jgi:hypothetical protein